MEIVDKTKRYIIFFISYLLSIKSIPYISKYVPLGISNASLNFLAVHGIAFVLMFFVFPKLLVYIYSQFKKE